MQAGATQKIEVKVSADQSLHMDTMFIDGLPFMVLMARPLDLIKITDLKGCQHATALNSSF